MQPNIIKTIIQALLVLLVILLFSGCQSADKNAPLELKIQMAESNLPPGYAFPPWKKASIEERMKHYGIPGVSIAVINNFKLEWAKGYGVMEAGEAGEAGTNRPVTTDTLFQALGVGIRLSHFLTLHLVDKGKAVLDEDINEKLVSWKLPDSPYTRNRRLTLRLLLRPRYSGLNHYELPGYGRDEPVPNVLQILSAAPPAGTPPLHIDREPGVCLCLPGGVVPLTGYILLQQYIEDITGQPFHQTARKVLLTPVGMMGSTFQQPLPPEFHHLAASGHERGGKPVVGKWRVFPQAAARGLWSTPSDLARFTVEFMNTWHGKSGKSNRVVSKKNLLETFNPKLTYFNLNDGSDGYYCSHVFNIKTGQGVVVMMNSEKKGKEFKRELLHSLFVTYRWLWGNFIRTRLLLKSLLLTLAIGIAGLIALLSGMLFLIRRSKLSKI